MRKQAVRRGRPHFDLTNKTYGDLKVLGYAASSRSGAVWWCRCGLCNREVKIPGHALRRATPRTDCGCRHQANLAERMRELGSRPKTPEQRKAISDALRASWTTEKRRAASLAATTRLSAAGALGAVLTPRKPWTDEMKAAAAERARNRWKNLTPEARAAQIAKQRESYTPQQREAARRLGRQNCSPEQRAIARERERLRCLSSPPNRKVDEVEKGFRPPKSILKVVERVMSDEALEKEWVSMGARNWICDCECGNRCIYPASKLAHGNVKSCGCRKLAFLRRGVDVAAARLEKAERQFKETVEAEQAELEALLQKRQAAA